jgi:hypothetical protein
MRVVICRRQDVASTQSPGDHMRICNDVTVGRDKKSGAALKAVLGLDLEFDDCRLRTRHDLHVVSECRFTREDSGKEEDR